MDADGPDADHLGEDVLVAVSQSNAPVMILKTDSQEIIAASPGAGDVLDGDAKALLGRSIEDFLDGDASGALPLLAAGRISGYETVRVLRESKQRRRLWIRALGGSSAVLAVLLKEDDDGRPDVSWRNDDAITAVIGAIDERLVVDRISSDVEDTLGLRTDEVVGRSFLTLIQQPDLAEVLSTLGGAGRRSEGVTLRVGVLGAGSDVIACQLVLLPLEPAPSCAFALLADGPDSPAATIPDLVTRLGLGIRGASVSRAVSSASLRTDVDLGGLSARELEIVTRLLSGDRVSSIARDLFLTPGTVRNYLSAAFGKLGVANQQELIELLRPASGGTATTGRDARSRPTPPSP